VFYRAGYIESWGRGIQKIRDACKNLGTDEPEYIVHGEDIMVKFNALRSAKVPNSKASNEALDEALDEALEMRLLKLLKEQPKLTQKEIVVELNISRATVQRLMKLLETSQRIERKGGKRYGYWEVR
jgi:ATP-dependent DNA helicase RecG